MEKAYFELWGITFMEPLGALLNWVLAAQCFYYFKKLRPISDRLFTRYWSYFFLFTSLSLIFGGFSHLLYAYMGMTGKIPGWSLAIIGISLGEFAMIRVLKNEKTRQLLRTLILAILGATITLLILDFSFKWVMFHATGIIFFLLIISSQRWYQGEQVYRYFIYATLCLLVTAGVKILRVSVNPFWFNENDISHLIMLVMYYLYFKGVKEVSKTNE